MRNKNYDSWEEKFERESEDTVHYDNIVDTSASYDYTVEQFDEEDVEMTYDEYVLQSHYGA
jgi:hypothetical protein